MKSNSSITRVMDIACAEHGEAQASSFFQDTAIVYTDKHIIKERRQEVGGRTFIVTSVFDRFATETAEDKLKSLVEMDAEKEVRKAV